MSTYNQRKAVRSAKPKAVAEVMDGLMFLTCTHQFPNTDPSNLPAKWAQPNITQGRGSGTTLFHQLRRRYLRNGQLILLHQITAVVVVITSITNRTRMSLPSEPDATRPNRPGKKRLFLTLTVLLSFLVSLPLLLKSTEIHRSPLPHQSISSLSSLLRSRPASSPCRFQAVFLQRGTGSVSPSRTLGRMIVEQMRLFTNGTSVGCDSCGGNFEDVSVVVDSGGDKCDRSSSDEDFACLWGCGGVRGIGGLDGQDDELVDELLDNALAAGMESCGREVGGRVYTVVVENGGTGRGEEDGKFKVVVGKHRHAWIVGEISEVEVVKSIAKVFVEVFIRGWVEDRDSKDQRIGEFMPVGSDGSVTLSFSLLNANPSDWVYDWDFPNIGEKMLAPVIEALAPLANVTIESQVLYHTPKSSFSYWDDKLHSHVFTTGDLPFFVNSKEWHLDTSIAAAGRSKVLQFVVYVPSAKECPLLLRLPNMKISTTNGFTSPMWGGVHVWNPPTCSSDSLSHQLSKNMISSEDLHEVFQVFIGQLRLLFGLKSDNSGIPGSGISSFLSSESGFTDWELDFLFTRHTCFNLLSCSTTLESLSTLVQSLPRMIVMDEIGKQVELSLAAATSALENATVGVYDYSAFSSRQARSLAEDAFFHPSIMSISYSSIEHYFAIYMPFFAPVAMHVLLAAVKELKRYKQEQRKFSVFTSRQQEPS